MGNGWKTGEETDNQQCCLYVAFLLFYLLLCLIYRTLYDEGVLQNLRGMETPIRLELSYISFFTQHPFCYFIHFITFGSHHPPSCCTQYHQLVSSNPAVFIAKIFEFPDTFAQSFVRDEC